MGSRHFSRALTRMVRPILDGKHPMVDFYGDHMDSIRHLARLMSLNVIEKDEPAG
jgi:hypothetical protein